MKTKTLFRPLSLVAIPAAAVILFSAVSTVSAQDKKERIVTVIATDDSTAKKDQGKQFKVKIIKEDNGIKTVIDTTFTCHDLSGMKQYQKRVKCFERQMKDLDGKMKDMEVLIEAYCDSADKDSTGRHNYAFWFDKDNCCPKIRIHRSPRQFGYDYRFPDVPEALDLEEEFELQGQEGHQPRVMIRKDPGETLSGILGNIPMNKVKSYQVIEKKGGRRIVIEIKD